jgi:hypothetical protein
MPSSMFPTLTTRQFERSGNKVNHHYHRGKIWLEPLEILIYVKLIYNIICFYKEGFPMLMKDINLPLLVERFI